MKEIIIIFGDSLTFYGPGGALPADDARIWPNILAKSANYKVELFAKLGWTARDVWWAVTQDPRIWALVPKIKLVIFAVGGMDSLPSAIPTAWRELIRYLRPGLLRKWVRKFYYFLQEHTAGWGWPQALPPRITVNYLQKTLVALKKINSDIEVVTCLPAMHLSRIYNKKHPGRIRTTNSILKWAQDNNLRIVDFYKLTRPAFLVGDYNPDGIHWSFNTHRLIAQNISAIINN